MKPYLDRIADCNNPIAIKLLNIMNTKRSNLALSADVITAEKLITLAKDCGPDICILKTHIDIIEDFTPDLTKELKKIAEDNQFLLFEDRKFADIGNTVKQQYRGGMYHICHWADMINAHSLPGPGIISALREIGLPQQKALILLAEMSSASNLFNSDYIQKTIQMANEFKDFVIGFVSQHKLSQESEWLYFTPGVQLNAKGDQHGQQYISPEQAIAQGADVIIVGRGIIHAHDPVSETRRYKEAGWNAYLKRLSTATA